MPKQSSNEKKSSDLIKAKIREWTTADSSPFLVISQDDGSFHLGYYSGMGNSSITPIEKLEPFYKEVIVELFQSGKLIESGKNFTFYPGSDFFKKLRFIDPNEVPIAIYESSLELFKTETAAFEWLNKGQRNLSGKAPIELLKEPSGEEQVLDLINRIRLGDFS